VGFFIKIKLKIMAICNSLTTGLDKSCDTNVGGINRFYIADYVELSPTISGGKITGLSPDLNQGIYAVTTTATITTSVVAGVYVINDIQVTGDLTSKIKVGKQIKFTYNTQFGGGTWTGHILSVSYNSGTNITTITPDFAGFTPSVGTVDGGAAPNNTSNQTVWTYLLYEFKTNKNVCYFTETANVDMTNGATFFTQTTTLVLSRRETTKRTAIEDLADGQKQLVIVVLDSNGIYWLFGQTEGNYLSAVEGGSGTAMGDANGYTLTFTAMEPEQAWEVDASVITKFIV